MRSAKLGNHLKAGNLTRRLPEMRRQIFPTSARRRRHPPSSDLKVPVFCAATATGSYSHFRFTFPATLASRRDSAPTPHRLFCRCVENVRLFFSSLPERQVFFIINTLFQDCPSLFLPGWPPNNPNKRKFFILFRFCTKSCCTSDRQILQLFFIMKGDELFYE